MSCSRSVVLLNNALKIAVMENGDLSLIQLCLDKEKRDITESVIAIYQNELNLLPMAKKNRCLRMRRRLTCMVMLLALHVLSIFPRCTGENTVKGR